MVYRNTNGEVKLNGSSISVEGNPSRPASANITTNDGKMTHFLATSSMTTGKPTQDGHIINLQ